MVDRREDILWVVPHPTPTSVTVSGAKQAMDTYMKECCLELLSFVVRNTTGHSIDKDGTVHFKYKGEWLSREELFENFL